MRENHYAFLVLQFENFLRFQVQDKHNASYTFVCSGKSSLYPIAKVVKFCDIIFVFRL